MNKREERILVQNNSFQLLSTKCNLKFSWKLENSSDKCWRNGCKRKPSGNILLKSFFLILHLLLFISLQEKFLDWFQMAKRWTKVLTAVTSPTSFLSILICVRWNWLSYVDRKTINTYIRIVAIAFVIKCWWRKYFAFRQ